MLDRARRGDADAFEQLVVKYQTQIYQLCFRITGNREDAADMTQEAFLKAWRNLEHFQGDSAFSTWLYRLASNACLDLLRSAKRRPQMPLTLSDEDGELQTVEPADAAPTPEECVIAEEERSHLTQAMARLDVQQRQLLTLRVVNELSYEEIATVLKLKVGTVKSRLARARDQLRKNLKIIGNTQGPMSSKGQKGGHGNGM